MRPEDETDLRSEKHGTVKPRICAIPCFCQVCSNVYKQKGNPHGECLPSLAPAVMSL